MTLVRASLAVGLLLAAISWVRADAGTDSLELEDVLRSIEDTHPDLEEARQNLAGARGKQFAAGGAWDPKVKVAGEWTPKGFYDTHWLDTSVRQAIPFRGAELTAGYRTGAGNFPLYKGDLETLSDGEFRAGIDVPLLRDGSIDDRRAAIARASLLVRAAECDQRVARLRLQKSVAEAYWTWVATGKDVSIQAELLSVAVSRDGGLREQAAQGSIPGIVVVDNERLVLDRRSKLVAARQKYQQATLRLSLLLRDRAKRPVVVSEQRLPAAIPVAEVGDIADENQHIEIAVAQRPELCRLRRQLDAAAVDVALARNQRAPVLNARGFVSRDSGAGPPELGPAEFGLGVTFEMPLTLRKARGELRVAQAKLAQMSASLRGLRDRITTEVRQARIDVEAARQSVDLAARQVEAARQLADAEREKFRQGATDLVVVNLREIAAADAIRLQIEALVQLQQAHADLNLSLGLEL